MDFSKCSGEITLLLLGFVEQATGQLMGSEGILGWLSREDKSGFSTECKVTVVTMDMLIKANKSLKSLNACYPIEDPYLLTSASISLVIHIPVAFTCFVISKAYLHFKVQTRSCFISFHY